ncbi:MAG: MBL fold metallo-hydrolase, partial [Gemmatimonadota bacterium]|nr:MBL fold metallo-hydrolase [Gemmatimonadota bacterium]
VHGIDDLRIFTVRGGRDLPAWVAEEHRDPLMRYFEYIFDDAYVPLEGSSKPRVQLNEFRAWNPLEILGHRFTPLRVPHGLTSVYGFRVGTLGYITDGKVLPEETLEALEGVEVLVLNALWFGRPHPSHFNVEEAVEAARRVGARRTFLTHLTHRVTHEELLRRLPSGVEPAHDGLTVEFDA